MVPVYVRLDVHRLCKSKPGPLVCARQEGSRRYAEDLGRNVSHRI